MQKTIDTIYKEMLTAFGQASGYIPHTSCDLAARLYAAAAQIQGLYHQAQWVLDQSFPQTAQGIYLEQHAALRGLTRGVATHATGVLRFGLSAAAPTDVVIKAGTVCMTDEGIRFATTEAAILPAGNLYTDVPAAAVEPGKAGNVIAGTITIMAAMPAGIQGCTNPEPFHDGDDAENDEALRSRLLDSYRRLPNGANAAYYEQIARSYNGVAAAVAVGRPRGVGSVDVYIAADEGIPDQDLLAVIRDYLQQRREISVDLQVLAPTPVPVNISVSIQPTANVSFATAQKQVEQALQNAFTGALLGKSVTLAYLGDLLYHLEGVANYRFSLPTSDVAASPTILPTLGTVTITEWEV